MSCFLHCDTVIKKCKVFEQILTARLADFGRCVYLFARKLTRTINLKWKIVILSKKLFRHVILNSERMDLIEKTFIMSFQR